MLAFKGYAGIRHARPMGSAGYHQVALRSYGGNSSKWFENQGPLWWRPLSPAVEGDATRGLVAKVTELQRGLNGSAKAVLLC